MYRLCCFVNDEKEAEIIKLIFGINNEGKGILVNNYALRTERHQRIRRIIIAKEEAISRVYNICCFDAYIKSIYLTTTIHNHR